MLPQKADLYRCLHEHKKTWSIKSRETEDYGTVWGHSPAAVMKDVEFAIQEAGRKRCLEKGQRNVHAFARGKLVAVSDIIPDVFEEHDDMMDVAYRPEWGEFREACRKMIRASGGEQALFYPDGTLTLINPNCQWPQTKTESNTSAYRSSQTPFEKIDAGSTASTPS